MSASNHVMSLEDFVAQSLTSLIRGVQKAQAELASSEAVINPEGTAQRIALQELTSPPAFPQVEFEVGVVVSKSARGKGGFKVSVPCFSLDVGADGSHNTDITNRLRFSIPVMLPPGQFIKPAKSSDG